MASQQGSRKRQRLASSVEGSHGGNRVVHTPVHAVTPAEMPTATNSTSALHEQALKSLSTDIEAMRSLVTCKVCNRLLYEPFSLSCGHTYCYSCLSSWMVSHSKKTCPDCRAHISQQPTPAYIVRELVLIFRNRKQLLPPGETVEEHQVLAGQEAKIVMDARADKDPNRGGLFQGAFAHGRRQRIQPIHDRGDNVFRCPDCHWELEDGRCSQCGREAEFDELEAAELDWSEDDEDEELDSDGLERDGSISSTNGDYDGDSDSIPGARRRTHDLTPQRYGYSEDEDEDLDPGGNLRDFVVNSDDDDLDGETSNDEEEDMDMPVPQAAAQHRRLVHRRLVLSDDDDDDDEQGADTETGLSAISHESSIDYDSESAANQHTPTNLDHLRSLPRHLKESESDDEYEQPSEASSVIYRGDRGNAFGTAHEQLADDDDDEASFDDDEVEVHDGYETGLYPALYGNFSPPQESVDETSTVRSDYDSDEHSEGYDQDDLEDDDEEEDGWDTGTSAPQAGGYTYATTPYPERHAPASRPRYNVTTARPFQNYDLPAHPFNLENTLARANFNQRALEARLVPARNESGNSVDLSHADARKRALSIAPDSSSLVSYT